LVGYPPLEAGHFCFKGVYLASKGVYFYFSVGYPPLEAGHFCLAMLPLAVGFFAQLIFTFKV